MDRQHFERFVKVEQDGLRRFLLNLCGSKHTADDLAQETFIRAYQNLHKFSGKSTARTWLYAIARNLFYDHLKSSASRHSTDVLEDSSIENLVDDAISNDIDEDLQHALAVLTAAEREVVLLHYMEEKSIREISAITNMSAGTIKSHMYRARLRLREFLQQYYER